MTGFSAGLARPLIMNTMAFGATAIAAATSREPGSEISGVPASDIRAIESPDRRRAMRLGVSFASLCS